MLSWSSGHMSEFVSPADEEISCVFLLCSADVQNLEPSTSVLFCDAKVLNL